MVENNDNIQQRDEDNNKRCRRYNKRKREDCMLLGGDFNWRIEERGARNWEEERGDGEKIQRQGKCRGEKTDGID
jgi:hypothetical protein